MSDPNRPSGSSADDNNGRPKGSEDSLPWNPAQLGIVHLNSSSRVRSVKSMTESLSSSPASFVSALEELPVGDEHELPHPVVPRQDWMTAKFRYVQNEDGHHVITGREGTITRCEDEPIRTPGAVQGFGVLIALEELDGTLVVRQVSENSTRILGLSPKYLFSLECFTDTLPEHQASLLWDSVRYLPDADARLISVDQHYPHIFLLSGWAESGSEAEPQKSWTCWCAAHRPSSHENLVILEFELDQDTRNPLYTPIETRSSSESSSAGSGGDASSPSSGKGGSSTGSETTLIGGHTISQPTTPQPPAQVTEDNAWTPSVGDIMESTISYSKPLPSMERMRRAMESPNAEKPLTAEIDSSPTSKGKRPRRRTVGRIEPVGLGMVDVFAIIVQINEQLAAAPDMDSFFKVLVGIIKELTRFHRVLVYQFDESWNGKVVAELVDWNMTHDLYKGLHFPAGDIPPQARELYAINQVRLLYDREQSTARLVARSSEDLNVPLDMTQCFLRAMSPIHLTYLGNMGVRASMSVSIMAYEKLWGLVACHSYGLHGMRVSFPLRQLLRLMSQSISRNIERLTYAQRFHTKKLLNTISSASHPTGYIVSDTDDLLGLFDADFGVLVIGKGAKVLGPSEQVHEILSITEYLRTKEYTSIRATQSLKKDYPDLNLSEASIDVFAGLLFIPLSGAGDDFIFFLRKSQLQSVHWAGKPEKAQTPEGELQPRKSFKIWSETVSGQSKAWTDVQLETAGVMSLVYGKFIEVWREKESALNATKLTNLILSNARHEVRTPLNHIINYLELALNGPLDSETRANLRQCHAASKNLLFTINDLLDLARLETETDLSWSGPLNLCATLEEATYSYKNEAGRRNIEFKLEISEDCPRKVIADGKNIRAAVQNLCANALTHTPSGSITVQCAPLEATIVGDDADQATAIQVVVSSSGSDISQEELDRILEQLKSSDETKNTLEPGVGFRLAMVARIVGQLGGQLRIETKMNEGSRFSFTIPVCLAIDDGSETHSTQSRSSKRSSLRVISRVPSLIGITIGAVET